ncbi:transcription termination/antitermination factor NusG [Tannerella sp. oral taxon 808]|jgi:transcription termination/antitermination factor nusG|nr:transcription termination/antitermination factor NusG [Tannerella sp. oral taxon 808]PNE27275.1 transcription termination/antitermination factor NusG [Tannerella sp. oral taxon 808]
MSDSQQKFYVLRAISGKENKVREYLESEIKNSDLGKYISQVVIPTEKAFVVRNGKKVMKERAYLPGYVLVEANLVGEVIHRLREIPNVIGFLGGDGQPVPLRPSEVNRILGTLDELQEQPDEVEVQYFVGETVKIISGPFENFSCLIEEVNADKKKLKVIVKIFGRRMPLELTYAQVDKE